MIFNMVGGGGGSGATLVVSSPVNVSVTVSKDDKSYTKNSGSLGSATFKGLSTGTWTVTISGNGQTATKTIEITADYAITIAFFSATINITYPANSNCVVANSGGQTVASDTNTTSSTKTWTAIVSATGTYTVTATATDGSGNSKSQSVEITSDGQSVSMTLSYQLHLFEAGVGLAAGYNLRHTGKGSSSANTTQITLNPAGASENNQTYISPAIDCSQFSTVSFIAERTKIQDMYSVFEIGLAQTPSTNQNTPEFAAHVNVVGKKTYALDLSSINGNLYFCIAACRDVGGYITDILFE